MSNFRIFSIGAALGFTASTLAEIAFGSLPDAAVANNVAFWGFWAVMCFGDHK